MQNLFEKTLNAALQYDERALEQLKQIHGKSFSIHFTDLNLVLYFEAQNQQLHLDFFSKKIADARLNGKTINLLNMLTSNQNSSIAMFENHLEIQGDLHVAEQFQILFKELDIDWEEALSEYIGDTPTFYLSRGIQKTKRFAKKIIRNFKSDLKDYITEEKRFTPSKIEVENFFKDVYTLHLDVERLAIRIALLQKEMSKS